MNNFTLAHVLSTRRANTCALRGNTASVNPKRTRAQREHPPQTAMVGASWQDSFSPQALQMHTRASHQR